MAKHAKEKAKEKHFRLIIGLIAATAAVITAAALLLIRGGIIPTSKSIQPAKTSSESSDSDEQEQSDEEPDSASSPVFARPDLLKGAWLICGVDYYRSAEDTGETVKAQIDAAFASLTEWKWNTVLVPLWSNGKPVYSSATQADSGDCQPIKNADGSVFDPVAYIRQCAKDTNMFTYGVLDTRIGTKDGWDPTTPEGIQAIHNMAGDAATLALDGYLLDNVGYTAESGADYASYMKKAPSSGFETYLKNSITSCVSDAVHTLKASDRNRYVGLLSDAVWASKANNENGSETHGTYESCTDGYADTQGWIQDGLFDFVMVKDDRAVSDTSASFGTVLDWWSTICASKEIPLYISHAADKVGTTAAGWKSPDQLAQQVLACKKAAAWKGSAFHSITPLQNDTSGSTKAMLCAFSGVINEEYISKSLTFASPVKTTFTTYESSTNIRGSADPNFPLLMNGQPIVLSDHGFFSEDLNLSLGKNTFTFEHKGTSVTYTITYRIVVLKSVQPSSKLELDGGTTINISACAYKGANVYAKVNGTTVSMKMAPVQKEDADTSSDSSSYSNYSGTYTLPDGIPGKEQNLGNVTVYGSYSGMSESKKGGAIVVKAKAKIIDSNPHPDNEGDSSSNPIAPGSGSKVLKSGPVVWISASYAETFSGNTTDDCSRPTNAYMPRGTTDVVEKSVYDAASGNQYYLLGCGRRVYQSSISLLQENGNLTANTIKLGSSDVKSDATVIALDADWHIPYDFHLLPQSYRNESKQEYDISSFTATYIDIRFHYTTEASGTPDVSSSPLFSSAEWINSGSNTYTLRLHLRKAGGIYGYSVKWNNSRLSFTFQNPPSAASGSKPLTGKRIVIDAGHGGRSIGTAGGKLAEKTMTLKYSLLLKDKLEALGATVVMTRTTDVNPDNPNLPHPMDARTAHARNNGTDLFISIHMDGNTHSSVSGYTVYYFNEYSKRYAENVNNNLKNAGLGTDSNGDKWKYFHVMRLHDCPSILVECGYMTNTKDLELIISSDYQEKFTSALANGIVDYFKSIG